LVLLDGRVQQARRLMRSIGELGLSGRVEVISARAEVAAHRPDLRFSFDAVVARSFGGPSVTAECGAGFLKPGGVLVVSDPPRAEVERWPAAGLIRLGLERERSGSAIRHFAVLRSVAPLDERYPRRTGVPAKRPLF
jgi:16S rRNA (guanine527-N7)-methyltransferase